MSYTGTIIGGVGETAAGIVLAGWHVVRIEQVEPASDRQLLVEKLKAIAESLPDMPEDWASQQDHYIHGTPKR